MKAQSLRPFNVALLLSAAILVATFANRVFAEGESAALPDPAAASAPVTGPQTAVFAGGCFWGVEGVFSHVKGVISATSGYAGGTTVNPGYEEVSTGTTGHAESVKVVFDPTKVTYGQLLKVFFEAAHNPTELNRQGPDSGTQYRSALFYTTPDEARVAKAYIAQLSAAKLYSKPIVTQVAPLTAFYPAEGYHQNYLALHPYQPYIVVNDLPKIAALKNNLPALYRE